MIDPVWYLTYILACAAVVIVPGPTVTVIIANSLRSGPRAGLLNVAGTQLGLATMVGVLAVGLTTVVSAMAGLFDVLRWLGAAYLIWLGVRMWRSDGELAAASAARGSHSQWFWQGFWVIWSNPKALLFFGAFIPQFVDPQGDPLVQTLLLGGTFMAVATLLDGAYALAAVWAGRWLTGTRFRLVEKLSG
ncbi:MAG: LysE family translocator [Candidatus Competibacterales bacterium]